LADAKEGYSFRCMRCLGGRITVPRGETTAHCPHCGQGWRITWVTPEVAKIRGRLIERGEHGGTDSHH
jgi:DNA-directed RNA polymerase subunit RPC12/RpoP